MFSLAGWSGAATPVRADNAAIAASIASADRPAADHERDAWAHPDKVLTLLGARPGMKVIDCMAGAGYYSELLARVVGARGLVTVYNNPGYAGYAGKELYQRFADKRVPNVTFKVAEIADLKLPADSLDAALFVMSWHDIYYAPVPGNGPMGDPAQMAATLHAALRHGGAVVIQDHVAPAGMLPAESVDKMHRIDPEVVKQTFLQAGFKLDAEDDSFRNAADDHHLLVFDPSIRHKTDQFLLRFRKP